MGASLLVFANKTDIADCMTDSEIQQVRDQGIKGTKDLFSRARKGNSKWAHKSQGLQLDAIVTHKWTIVRCSARTRGEELGQGLEWVVQDAKDRLFLY